MRHRNAAFTLVELLIVVIIIAVIAAIAIPKFTNANQRSLEASVRTQIGLVRNAVNTFQSDTGWWPATLDDLAATTAPAQGLNGGGQLKPLDPTKWHGPYIGGQAVPPQYVGWISYTTSPPGTGTVYCPLSGTALDGSSYSTW